MLLIDYNFKKAFIVFNHVLIIIFVKVNFMINRPISTFVIGAYQFGNVNE